MTGELLSGDDLDRLCGGRWHGHDGQAMIDVEITPPMYDSAVEATVVPTRMHAPGWYIRSRTGPLWASWLVRSDEDLAMMRRFADAGRIRCVA